MAKIYGLQGYLQGKLGSTVFAIRNGQQLARQYNPSVSNPKTAAQVSNRAKLKLLSQLSQAVSKVIAIPRRGMQSPRNIFTKANYEYVGYANGTASIPMADILLTNSYAGLVGFRADRTSGNAIHVELMESVANNWDKIVYVVLKKTESQQIMPATSLVVDVPGENGVFPADLDMVSGAISVHAYGVRLNTIASRVAFSNLRAPRAEEVAKIVTNRTYSEGDMNLSETRGLYLESNETQGETSGVSMVRISAVAYDRTSSQSGVGGTVTGTGNFELGSSVTLVATPAEDYAFVGWRESVSGNNISTSPTFTFTAEGSVTYYAVFRSTLVADVTLSVVRSSASTGSGTVSGGGVKQAGATVTVEAHPDSGVLFDGWYTNNGVSDPAQAVSLSPTYTFTMPSTDYTLYALFGVGGDE